MAVIYGAAPAVVISPALAVPQNAGVCPDKTSMVNIQLTSGHAFNKKSGPGAARSLSWENLIYIADFLPASGQRRISLEEGELTVHPHCVDFILYLLDRGFDVTFCTDGFLNPSRLAEFKHHLTKAPAQRLTVVCRLKDPVQSPAAPEDLVRLHHFLALMGPWTQAGFEIDRLDFSLDFLFDLISRFGLQPHLRLSLAHPGSERLDRFVPAEETRQLAARLYSQRKLFEIHRVRPHLDCGFTLCQFSDEELGWLYRCGGPPLFGCRAALHLSPDLSVSHCFPCAAYPLNSLFEFDSLGEINQHFSQWRERIRQEIPGISEDCPDCRCREEGVCGGGALCRLAGASMASNP